MLLWMKDGRHGSWRSSERKVNRYSLSKMDMLLWNTYLWLIEMMLWWWNSGVLRLLSKIKNSSSVVMTIAAVNIRFKGATTLELVIQCIIGLIGYRLTFPHFYPFPSRIPSTNWCNERMLPCSSELPLGVNSSQKLWRWAPEETAETMSMERSRPRVAWTTLCTSSLYSGNSYLRLFHRQVSYSHLLYYWNNFHPPVCRHCRWIFVFLRVHLYDRCGHRYYWWRCLSLRLHARH